MYYGDVNNDGSIDMGDVIATEILMLAIGSGFEVDADAVKRADVDGDGAVTQADIALIEQYIMGSITRFPVEDMQPAPTKSWWPWFLLGGLGIVLLSRKR